MNTLKLIIQNGFNTSTLDLIVSEYNLDGYVSTHSFINSDFNKCEDLESIKAFSKIMDDKHHVLNVEPRMINLMGEDEYFDFIG